MADPRDTDPGDQDPRERDLERRSDGPAVSPWLVIAPGNPGMEKLGELAPLKVTDADGLAALAREMKADLVVVGPETALEAGLADRLTTAGIPCFGPTKKAAQLETSKAFSKAFMERHEIPTAGYGVYERLHEARQALTVF